MLGQTHFDENVHHNQEFERNMKGQVHFDEYISHN
jgi:hypothetical protein